MNNEGIDLEHDAEDAAQNIEQPLACGHYLPEEAPQEMLAAFVDFLGRDILIELTQQLIAFRLRV